MTFLNDSFRDRNLDDRLERFDSEQQDRLEYLLEQKLTNARQHKVPGLAARKTVLALLVVAAFLALVGLFFSYCSSVLLWSGFVWAGLLLLATIFSLAGVIVFFINTHDFDNMYTAGSTKTSLTHGYSFYCAIAATSLFFIASIIAALTAALYTAVSKMDEDDSPPRNSISTKTWPINVPPATVQLHMPAHALEKQAQLDPPDYDHHDNDTRV